MAAIRISTSHLALLLVLLLLMTGLSLPVQADGHVRVYIISPSHGERVSSPVKVRFGLQGMGVAPAGVERKATGHHHLLIDVEELPAMDQPVPADDKHRHFGGGQTEAEIELSAGRHRLQLLFADHLHIPHKPVIVSEPIEIYVH